MRAQGFSVTELLVAIVLSAVIFTGMQRLLSSAGELKRHAQRDNEILQSLDFALQRMVHHARHTDRLMLPAVDRPMTSSIDESLRDEVVGGGGAQAVLAVTLPRNVDRDADGFADADNDRDGRVDEDTGGDATQDGEPGIFGIDDDGDGSVDEGFFASRNDDEYLFVSDEDPQDGIDDDDDGTKDDDWGADQNGDGAPGITGVDDDGDGSVDEGSVDDDDEDGVTDEDWLDPVVYYLQGSQLIERLPVPWDADGDSDVDGRDFSEQVLLDGVARFRVERVPTSEVRYPLLDLTIQATADGQTFELNTRVRLGSRS